MKFNVSMFEMPVIKDGMRIINASAFWKQENVIKSGIANEKGVYFFCIKRGNKYMPYYVGKASRQNFKTETTNTGNLRKYEQCINKTSGKAFMGFMAIKSTKKTETDESLDNLIDSWETLFILITGLTNENLKNKSKTSCNDKNKILLKQILNI